MKFTFFYRPKPKRFNPKPRFYDPEAEERAERRRRLGLEREDEPKRDLRERLHSSWGARLREQQEDRKSKWEIVKWVAILGLIIYFLFFAKIF